MTATVIAALIVAAVSLIASCMSYWASRQARRAVDRHRSEDYRIRQLNELYGPLYMLRAESKQLRLQLNPDLDHWRLIENIEAIWSDKDDSRQQLVERILEINEAIQELIVGKAGLLVDVRRPPESFKVFLHHATTLRQHWNRRVNVTDRNAYVPFPAEIDADIRDAVNKIVEGLPPAD